MKLYLVLISGALLISGCASVPMGDPKNAQLDSEKAASTQLGAALEKMQAFVITSISMDKECAEEFPNFAPEFMADLKQHLKSEAKIYQKVSDTWKQLSDERPREVQAFYWVQERRIGKLLQQLRSAPDSDRKLEWECRAYFADLRTGALRRTAPDMFSLLDRFADGRTTIVPTYPVLDEISERLRNER